MTTDPVGPIAWRVLAAGSAVLGLRIAFLACTFGTTAILARLLPPAEMGMFFLCASTAGLIALVMNIGLPGLAVRDIARHRARAETDAASAVAAQVARLSLRIFVLQVLLGFVAACFALAGWLPWDPALLVLASLLAGVSGLQAVLGEIFRGFGRVAEASLFGGVVASSTTLLLAAVAWASTWQGDARLALVLTLLGHSAALAVGFRRLRLPRTTTRIPISPSRFLAASSRVFWVSALASYALYQADLWIVGLLLPLNEVAVYGAAVRVAQPLLLPVEAAEAAVAPDIVGLHARGAAREMQRMLANVACVQFFLVFTGTLFLCFYGREILALLLGATYLPAYPVLMLLAVGFCVRAACGAFGYLLMFTEHARLIAVSTAIWVLATVALDATAGRLFGMGGVAVAAAGMLSLFCIGGAFVAWRLTGLRTDATLALLSRVR